VLNHLLGVDLQIELVLFWLNRSKLAVLPEEQAGQVSRRESMNRGSDDCGPKAFSQDHYYNRARHNGKSGDAANAMSDDDLLSTVTSSKSDCGGASRHSNPNDAMISNFESSNNHPVTDNCYTSLRYRKMALRRKRSLSVADLPMTRQTNPNNQLYYSRKKV